MSARAQQLRDRDAQAAALNASVMRDAQNQAYAQAYQMHRARLVRRAQGAVCSGDRWCGIEDPAEALAAKPTMTPPVGRDR